MGFMPPELLGMAGPARLRARELRSIGERLGRKADDLALDLTGPEQKER
jgi:hypothetical protein